MNEKNSIQTISIDRLQPHPKNPRLTLRADVITGIAGHLKESGFDPAHAIIVRPVAKRFEIVSGHQRLAAAVKAGLNAIPCWVREMDDEAAFMIFVTSNNQGELSPLEIGSTGWRPFQNQRTEALEKWPQATFSILAASGEISDEITSSSAQKTEVEYTLRVGCAFLQHIHQNYEISENIW